LSDLGSSVKNLETFYVKAIVFGALTLAGLLGALSAAGAQSYTTGQKVFANPSGASNNWYSGCVVGAGRSNNSYQVECGGTLWWITADNIRLTAPAPGPDPMRPGQTLTPVITPSASPTKPAPAAATPTQVAQRPAGEIGPGNYAPDVARRIAKGKVDAANAVLKNGKYSCYAGGQYTFSDLYITRPHTYEVKPGGKGAFSYANGALTFTSGPYAGAYSRMVDGKTIGVSAKGNTNLGTQCEYDN
jgi:hypothetical protein